MPQEIKRTITIETKKSENKLREFRKEMTKLRGELISLEEGTEEYNRVLTELSNRQQKLNDVQEDIRNSMQDLGARITNLSRVTRGAVGGFTAIQGAINLLGASGTELEPMLKQMGNLLAIIEGLEQVEGLTKSIPQLIASFKGMGQELSNWFGNIFNTVDNRIEEAADSLTKIEDGFDDINIKEFVEPLDEANKKLTDAADNTRRLTDFVEPIGSEVEKIRTAFDNVSVASKTTAEKMLQVAKVAQQLDGEPLERMRKAADLLGYDFDELTASAAKARDEFSIAAKTVDQTTKSTSLFTKATNLGAKAAQYLGYALKTLGLTALVVGLAEAFTLLWKNKDKVIEYFTGITKPMKEAAKTMEKLKEALAAVNQELYPETNKSRLADAHSEAMRRRIDLEEELLRLEERYAKIPKTVWLGFWQITNPALKTAEERINKVKKQLEEINELLAKSKTASHTYTFKELQDKPLEEPVISTPTAIEDTTPKGPIAPTGYDIEYDPEAIIRQVADVYKSRLDTEKWYYDELLKIQQNYNDQEKMNLAIEQAREEQRQKTVNARLDALQSLGDTLYGISQIYYESSQVEDLTDEQREKRLKNYRKLLIATAAIDTAVATAKAVQAAIGAMADTPGPLWTRIAAWGSVLATGLAGVAQMISAFNSGNIYTDSSSASVTPANYAPSPVSYSRNLLTDEETDQLNKPIQCYMVESQAKDVMTKVDMVESNATF